MSQIFHGENAQLQMQRVRAAREGLTVRQVALRNEHPNHSFQERCPECNPAARGEPQNVPAPVFAPPEPPPIQPSRWDEALNR